MARPRQDPLVLMRQHVKGLMYLALVGLRSLGVAPCLFSAYKYTLAAVSCFRANLPRVHCAKDTLFPGLWALVSTYMLHTTLDGLFVRWIVTYSRPAALIRMVAITFMALLFIHSMCQIRQTPIVNLLVWIIIACVATAVYILQTFIASNLADGTRERTLNLFKISVYAVVPVGLASFVTMIGLIRTLALMQYALEE